MATGSLMKYLFLRLLLPLIVGIWCGDIIPHTFSFLSCLLAALFLIFSLIISRWQFLRWLYGPAVYLFFFAAGHQCASRQLEKANYAFTNKTSTYRIRIHEDPEIKARSILCTSILINEFVQDTLLYKPQNSLFLLYFPKDSLASTLKRGDEVLINTSLSPPVNNGNPDEFDYVRYLKHKGVAGTAYVPVGHWKVIGHDSLRSFRQVALDYREKIVSLYRNLGFNKDELAVLSALTVGHKDDLSEDIVETYSITGASHVLALSGLHIGFIYALFWFLFSPLWKRWRVLKPFLLLFIILFLWGFAFLTGLSSSVVRSVVMFSFLALASLQPEKPLTLNTVLATAFLMLLCNPLWLFDVGFQLSFSAVIAIILIQPKLYALWKVKNLFLRYVWGIITVSLAAQLGTAPLVVFYFSRFSTHFLLTNLWVIPMVSLIMYSAVLLLLLSPFPFLQHMFSGIVEALVRIQNHVLRWIEQLPYASIDGLWIDAWQVGMFYLLIALVYRSCVRCTVRRVYWALSLMLVIVAYNTASIILYAPQHSIMFYNVRGCPAVHCLANGAQSWLVCADSLPDTSRLRRTLSPHWNRIGLEEPQLITGDFSTKGLFFRKQLLYYSGKRIIFLNDSRWKNKTAAHPFAVDYLYISRGYTGNLNELLSSLFLVKTVVLDSSLSAYHKEDLINVCIRRGISYLSLSEKGFVRILL